MKILKSPLLLVGILVVLLAAGGLIAPLFIDWGSYRATFEQGGKQLTGRDTEIKGDISVRLFPWPRITVGDVRVANPPGARLKSLFRAEEIEVRFALAPLLSGRLEVEGIDVNRPIFGLERMANGRGTWQFKPEKLVGDWLSADDVALVGVSITNGRVVLADGKRGGRAHLDGFNAFVSAPTLKGPWKLRGEAVVNDDGIAISINTGKWRAGSPLKFAVKLSPSEGAGLTYAFDGQTRIETGGEINGTLKVTPNKSRSGKSNAEADFRAVGFKSNIKANFDSVLFTKIEIAPVSSLDTRTFVTGDALVELGTIIRVTSTLKASQFEVNSVLGNRGRKTAGSLAAVDAVANFINDLPPKIHVKSSLDIGAFVVGKDRYESLKAEIELFEETLTVKSLRVALPGQTRATFSGRFLTGVRQPQLLGDLSLDMISAKAFTKWVFAEHARTIEEKWSGERGRLKVSGKFDVTRDAVRLLDGRYGLDGVDGKVEARLWVGNEPALAVRVSSDLLNLDRYAPDGLLGPDARADLPGYLINQIASLVGERDLGLTFAFKKLTANRVTANDVRLDFDADENGVVLRDLRIGKVGDARLDLKGRVAFDDAKVAGSLEGMLDAENPAVLFQLAGFGDKNKAWLKAVTPLKISVSGRAESHDGAQTDSEVRLKGTAGTSQFGLTTRFVGTIKEWRKARLHLSGRVQGTSGKGFLTLLDINAPHGKDGPGRVAFTATGTLDKGLASTADLDVFGLQSQFSGTVVANDKERSAKGRLAVLVENSAHLLSVLGVHAGSLSPIARVISAEGQVVAGPGRFEFTQLRGTALGSKFSGSLKAKTADNKTSASVVLETTQLSLPGLLDGLLLGRDGLRHGEGSRFSPENFAGVDLTLTVNAEKLALWPGFETARGVITASSKDGLVIVDAKAGDGDKPGARLHLEAKLDKAISRLSGELEGDGDLAQLLRTGDNGLVVRGKTRVKMKFSGAGRTPGGVLASLTGSGQYDITGGEILRLSPRAFSQNLGKAENAKDVEAMIAKDLRGGDMAFGGGKGKLSINAGVVTLEPLKIDGAGAKGHLRAVYELANGLVDVSIRLQLDQPAKVPPFEIAFAGPPEKLAPSSDFAALKSHLSVAALNRTLDKLEALQEEQRRLFEQEKREREAAETKRREQLEKQRKLRERQRELLRKATEAKKKKEAEDAEKKVLEAKPKPKPKPKAKKPETPPASRPPVVETAPPRVKKPKVRAKVEPRDVEVRQLDTSPPSTNREETSPVDPNKIFRPKRNRNPSVERNKRLLETR